jgi:hypothetical protein
LVLLKLRLTLEIYSSIQHWMFIQKLDTSSNKF